MSPNKVYGDNPNKLKLNNRKTRYEITTKVNFKGIREDFLLIIAHSFFEYENLCRFNCSMRKK